MKKALLLIFMFAGFAAFAQTAQSVSIEYNKTRVPGASIVIAGYDVAFVQSALVYRLEKVGGLKGTNSRGFRLYAAQNFPYFGNLKYDIFTLVDKGKKDPVVTLNLLVSKGNDNFISPSENPELTQKMLDFLTEFNAYMKEYEKVVKIEQLTTLTNKLEKELNSITSDRDKLQRDLDNLQGKLNDKIRELTIKDNEYQKAKEELDSIKD